MEFIYYPRCSTCLKALKQLRSLNLDFSLRDIVKDTPTQEELLQWIQQYNQGIKPFFNTSGKVYKELNLKEKIGSMTIQEAASLLASHGMLIKRPLIILENQIIIGYQEEIYKQL